jgi:hypothetical protein
MQFESLYDAIICFWMQQLWAYFERLFVMITQVFPLQMSLATLGMF